MKLIEREKSTMSKSDIVTNLTFFLLENTGSIFGIYKERMSAIEQRKLFGCFLGKGKIIINGLDEDICCRIKIAFGGDYEDRYSMRWIEL